MSLFTGQAWFSPRVPTAVRKAWSAHGGSDAGSNGDPLQATYFFCDGNDDPWFPKLYQRSMAVFHWLWVTAVVNARFRVSISAYAIDEHTVLDVSDCPAPAYSHGPARRIDVARVQQVANDRGDQSDNSSASRARTSRKIVRIVDDASTVAEDASDPHAGGGSSRRKRKSVPFVDLRSVKEKRKVSTTKRSRSMKIALCVSGKMRNRVMLPRDHQDMQVPTEVPVSTPALGPSSREILVSDALESLSYVSTRRTTQFIPGAIYEDKEFRCFYVR